jgi:branched-chain amino acid transport system substrate-binding protein
LVTQDEVFAIVSPLGTPTNLAVLDYLLDKGIPVISPHSGLSVWSTPLKHTYFALQPSYRVEGRILAQYALAATFTTPSCGASRGVDGAELEPGRIAILAVDDQFGQEGATAFTEELGKAGVRPVLTLMHPTREGGAGKWVQQLAAAQPDLVLLYTYVKTAADVLLAAHAARFRPAWLGSYVVSGPDLIRLAGAEAAEGLHATSYAPGPRSHRGEPLFRKLMSRLYGEEDPGTHSRIGYAAAQLVVEGLQRTGPELTREGLIAALETLENWSGGLVPPISYSAQDHRGLTALSLLRAKGGRWLVQQDLLELRD